MKKIILIISCVVLTIVTLLVAVGYVGTARMFQGRKALMYSEMRNLESELYTYYLDAGVFPTTKKTDFQDTGFNKKNIQPYRSYYNEENKRSSDDLLTIYNESSNDSRTDLFDPLGRTYKYINFGNEGFIISSVGPDIDREPAGDWLWDQGTVEFDGDWKPERVFMDAGDEFDLDVFLTMESDAAKPTAYTYDPSNGTFSEGDTWRGVMLGD